MILLDPISMRARVEQPSNPIVDAASTTTPLIQDYAAREYAYACL